MEVFKIKKHFGMTEDQAVELAKASAKRSRPEAHLMREYISKGAQHDLADWDGATDPTQAAEGE